MKQLHLGSVIFLIALAPVVNGQGDLPYTTYKSFSQVLEGKDARYPATTRVSDPGTTGHRAYTGFFYQSHSG